MSEPQAQSQQQTPDIEEALKQLDEAVRKLRETLDEAVKSIEKELEDLRRMAEKINPGEGAEMPPPPQPPRRPQQRRTAQRGARGQAASLQPRPLRELRR